MAATLISPSGRFDLGPTAIMIGRARNNQLVINDQLASSHHAEIRPAQNVYTITDVGSANGTYVNGQRIPPNIPIPLNSGDAIRIGQTSFTYQLSGPPPVYPSVPSIYSDQSSNPAYQPTTQVPPAPTGRGSTAPLAYQVPPSYQQSPSSATAYPGSTGTSLEPRRRIRWGLWIMLLLLALMVLGGAGAYVYANRSTPEKTLTTYCNAIKSGDAATAYDQYSTRVKQQESEQRFAALLTQAQSPVLGGFKDCVVSNVQQNGSTATGTITLSFNNIVSNNIARPLVFNLSLITENGVWKIDRAAFV